jgi:hypothetical protein
MLTVNSDARETMTVDHDDYEETFQFHALLELITPWSWHVVARNLTTGRLFFEGRLGRVSLTVRPPDA